jgi:hypothetical protein
MSDTPKLPDETQKLLDNGWSILLFGNSLGSYTAIALSRKTKSEQRVVTAAHRAMRDIPESQITDDFLPSQSLTRLASKVFGCEVPPR